MASRATEVSTIGLVDTKGRVGRRKRRQWSEAVKRRIVAEDAGNQFRRFRWWLGANDANANQVFKWRRGMAPEQVPAAKESVPLLPTTEVSGPLCVPFSRRC
jgi:hypothetical protein